MPTTYFGWRKSQHRESKQHRIVLFGHVANDVGRVAVSAANPQSPVYLDDQYAKADFKTKHVFQLKDEGISWARGWGQSTDVLMAAYTLAGSDW